MISVSKNKFIVFRGVLFKVGIENKVNTALQHIKNKVSTTLFVIMGLI